MAIPDFNLSKLEESSANSYIEKIQRNIEKLKIQMAATNEINQEILATIKYYIEQMIILPAAEKILPYVFEEIQKNDESDIERLTNQQVLNLALSQEVKNNNPLLKSNPPLVSCIRLKKSLCALALLKAGNAKTLVQSHTSASALINVLQTNNDELFLLYLQNGADPNKAFMGVTPLVYMLINNKMELFNEFTKRFNDNLDYQVVDNEDRNLLHLAVIFNNDAAIALLLDNGLNPGAKDIYGYSPIDYAMFSGKLEVACRLSGKLPDEIKGDPKFGKSPPLMDHTRLVQNILQYIKLKHNFDDPTVKFELPAINEGICNGWSMAAAVALLDSEEKYERFLGMCDLFCKWDGTVEFLQSIPEQYKDEFDSVDQIFQQLTNDIYVFFAQYDANIGVSNKDREKQLELVSDKKHIQRIADFGLPDLTMDEQQKIYALFRPVADQMLLDISSSGHTVMYCQKSEDKIFYLDSNRKFRLPTFENYESARNMVQQTMAGNVISIGFYHENPTLTMMENSYAIVNQLIKEFILEKPERIKNIPKIANFACEEGLPILLNHLLNNPSTSPFITNEVKEMLLYTALNGNSYECAYVLLKNDKNIAIQGDLLLGKALQMAIMYDDKELFDLTKASLGHRLEKTGSAPNPDQATMMKFPVSEAPIQEKLVTSLYASSRRKSPAVGSSATDMQELPPNQKPIYTSKKN
jgi:ankyrin repeat protein